jgi:hypothetical protein
MIFLIKIKEKIYFIVYCKYLKYLAFFTSTYFLMNLYTIVGGSNIIKSNQIFCVKFFINERKLHQILLFFIYKQFD